MAGPTTKKTLWSRADFRELLTRQLTERFNKEGLADYLFGMLTQIEDPATRLKYTLEVLKFVAPQMASMKVEVEQSSTPVTMIQFVEVAPHKALTSNDN